MNYLKRWWLAITILVMISGMIVEARAKDIELGLKGGVSLARFYGTGAGKLRPDSLDDFRLDPVLLPSPVFALMVPIHLSDHIILQPELVLAKSGERYRGERPGYDKNRDSYDDSAWVRISWEQYRANVPVFLKAVFPTESKYSPYVYAGPGLSALFKARLREQKYHHHYNSTPYSDSNTDITAHTRRADLLFCGGVGVDIESSYGSLTLDLRCTSGVIPFDSRDDSGPIRHASVALMTGFTLGH